MTALTVVDEPENPLRRAPLVEGAHDFASVTESVAKVAEGKAAGTIETRYEGHWRLRVRFRARWERSAWALVELSLPSLNVFARRGEKGEWRRYERRELARDPIPLRFESLAAPGRAPRAPAGRVRRGTVRRRRPSQRDARGRPGPDHRPPR